VGQPPGSDDGRLERKNMIIGTCMNGKKCVYDLPIKCETVEQFESLIYGYNNGRLAESQREELYNQPKLLGLNGPMYNGEKILKSTGEAPIPITRPVMHPATRSTGI